MDCDTYTSQLFKFLSESPTAFHAVSNICNILRQNGFTELYENNPWNNISPGSYFVCRNGSSLIAFVTDDKKPQRLKMAGAHTDSPALKIKPNPIRVNHEMLQLGVEVYGGALLDPWFDRDLSLAGRITIREASNSIKNILIDFKRPV